MVHNINEYQQLKKNEASYSDKEWSPRYIINCKKQGSKHFV